MKEEFNKKLESCLQLQNKLNCLIDPEWTEKNRDWSLAMLMELVEAIDHIGYKWWKHTEPNVEQAFIEVVDAFHFLLSHVIENQHRTNDWYNVAIFEENNEYNLDSAKFEIKRAVADLLFVELDTEPSSNNSTDIFGYLCAIAAFLGYSPDDILRVYLQKNVLNIFRQHNGYKEGTYVKIWNGKEDNEVMAEIMATMEDSTFTADALYKRLEEEYKNAVH